MKPTMKAETDTNYLGKENKTFILSYNKAF